MAIQSIPHLALPIEILGGRFASVDQDTSSEIACCVQAIVAFPKGYRVERPDFGADNPTFDQIPLDTGELESDIREWEPRAELVFEEETVPNDPGGVRLTIHVTSTGD